MQTKPLLFLVHGRNTCCVWLTTPVCSQGWGIPTECCGGQKGAGKCRRGRAAVGHFCCVEEGGWNHRAEGSAWSHQRFAITRLMVSAPDFCELFKVFCCYEECWREHSE